MDDVIIAGDKIYPPIVDTDNSFACTADARPHTYLVGVDRSRLPEPKGFGGIIEPGYPWEYRIDLICGWEGLGQINSYHWVATSSIPSEWLDATEGQSSAVVDVTINEGDPEPFVEVAFAGHNAIYEIGEAPSC